MGRSLLFTFAATQLLTGTALFGGELFFHSHRERTRCSIPNYSYRAGGSPAVSVVSSESAVVILDTSTPSATQSVPEFGRAFVFNDLKAGPMVLTSLAAKTDRTGNLIVTGTINHTGGDSQQLLGGKAVIRVEPLTSAGTGNTTSTVLACKEASCWVRRNEPETIQIALQYSSEEKSRFGQVERVRVFLEYHPNR